jgi:hypothetical protein
MSELLELLSQIHSKLNNGYDPQDSIDLIEKRLYTLYCTGQLTEWQLMSFFNLDAYNIKTWLNVQENKIIYG